MNTRTIETLDRNLKTVNVWNVPENVSLDMVANKQHDTKIRTAYFAYSHPVRNVRVK